MKLTDKQKEFYLKEGNYFYITNYIRHLIVRKKKGVVITVLGAPGDGKSIIALTLAYLLDKEYRKRDVEETLKRRVVYTNTDFLKAIKGKDMKPFSTIVYEDAGTIEGTAARRFMTIANQALTSVLQTIRRERFVVIITVQMKKLLDSHLKDTNLAHISIGALDVDQVRQQNIFKTYFLEHSTMSGVTYNKFPEGINPITGRRGKIRKFRCKLRLPNRVLKAYEKFSRERKDELERKIAQRVTDAESKDSAEVKKSINVIVDELMLDIQRYVRKEQVPPYLRLGKTAGNPYSKKKWNVIYAHLVYTYNMQSSSAREVKDVVEIKLKTSELSDELERIYSQQS